MFGAQNENQAHSSRQALIPRTLNPIISHILCLRNARAVTNDCVFETKAVLAIAISESFQRRGFDAARWTKHWNGAQLASAALDDISSEHARQPQTRLRSHSDSCQIRVSLRKHTKSHPESEMSSGPMRWQHARGTCQIRRNRARDPGMKKTRISIRKPQRC